MIILLDMDDVLADFDGEFLRRWRKKYPKRFYVALEDRKEFDTVLEYPAKFQDDVRDIYNKKGFIRSLPPMPGSLEAVVEMRDEGNDVFICTSPLSRYRHCVSEKYEWVEEHLGFEWTKKVILTKDKTLVNGDYLVDDNPKIKGIAKPAWEHVVYDNSYNRHLLKHKRIKNLKEWKSVLVEQ